MQEEVVDGGTERRVLIGMVTNAQYLARLLPYWEQEPLRSRWGNILADWCVRHFRKFNEAPNKGVITYYEKWAKTTGEVEQVRLMLGFLQSLSDEYDRAEVVNTDALLDETETLLTEIRLERVYDQGRQLLRVGDTKGAAELTATFKPARLRTDPSIDVLRDRTAQELALEAKATPLIRYVGGIGAFYDAELARNSLVIYFAPIKTGKSFLILENCWQAMLQRTPVAYFQIGDMTPGQIMGRFNERAVGRPMRAGMFKLPTALRVGANYMAETDLVPVQYDTPMQKEQLIAYDRLTGKLGREYLRLKHYPTGTVSFADIEADLESWKNAGFFPKVIGIDYPENLAPLDRKASPDKQVAETWARARALSEQGYCVISASQTNKEGFRVKYLTRSNFRGSLMSLAHATCAIGINQDDTEKQQQVMRLNYMVKRGGDFAESKCCVISGCLAIAKPAMLSWWQI